ncbi:MAG: hypothetical protein CL760_11795 [Chloroflexi bacterium]|nr:hypothetical protein [Chloroflexota bacterium]|tara:strand:+ start:73261 stop:73920 length:660 start_codon:yes stop_codon:yes gene_type:complete
MNLKEVIFERKVPKKEEYNSFVVSAFSKKDKKVINTAIIPIEQVIFDSKFQSQLLSFLEEILKDNEEFDTFSPYQSEISFRLHNSDYDRIYDDYFGDFEDRKKEKFFYEAYKLKDKNLYVRTKDYNKICFNKFTDNKISVLFRQIPNVVGYQEAIDQYKNDFEKQFEKIKNLIIDEISITEREFYYLFLEFAKGKKEIIRDEYRLRNFINLLKNYKRFK